MHLNRITLATSAPDSMFWGRRAQPHLPRGAAQFQIPWPHEQGRTAMWTFGFLLLHLPLAFLMKQWPLVAAMHAMATLSWGLWLCVGTKRSPLLLQWVVYMVGAEVLWRMCRAPVFWEFAKHSICFVCIVSLLRSRPIKTSLLPLLYFGLLIPAAFITFAVLPLNEARQAVSFYLAAPMCLAVCAMRFSSMRLTAAEIQRIAVALLGPIIGIAFLALFRLATTDVDFGTTSNFAASGGFGPNQVSAMLGLGALFAIFFCLSEKRLNLQACGFVALALWLLAQASLTFSRSGLYMFGAAFGVGAAYLVQRRGSARRVLLTFAFVFAAACAAFPALNSYTGGALVERFRNTGLTGRDQIAKEDLAIWLERPVFGAGAGVSARMKGLRGGFSAASHTEYTRLLADHGLLGLTSLCVLLLMAGQAWRKARGPWAKAIVVSLVIWCLLFMATAAMRLAAPAVLLGLIHARFVAEGRAPAMAAGKCSRLTWPVWGVRSLRVIRLNRWSRKFRKPQRRPTW